MKRLADHILSFYEKNAFGVFAWLGDKMSMGTGNIRMAFIYLSFITFGSPIFLYLIAAFILKHKEYFKPVKRHGTIWEL
jgi:phage shock protein C